MSYRSSFETYGEPDLPDYIYYNANIINNTTNDLGTLLVASQDPQIRFNETRDAALVKDASQYHFSIIRFTMNGSGRNLPLFIPSVQIGQADPNKTIYSVAVTYQQKWNLSGSQTLSLAIAPPATFVTYAPEILNTAVAPVPGPPTTQQDLSTNYYYVYTYQHWLDLVNAAILTAYSTLWTATQTAWNAGVVALGQTLVANPFPFPTINDFLALVNPPQIIYSPTTQLFTIYGDAEGYGTRIGAFINAPYVGPATPGRNTASVNRIFMNANMWGLFANFPIQYWNSTTITSPAVNPAFAVGGVPEGYAYEILFPNLLYTNVLNQLANASYVPATPYQQRKNLWINTQGFPSTDQLWSPIGSIVFTTTLLPIRNEATGQPIVLGTGNLGNAATSQSAFTPIITDIAEDLTVLGSATYKSSTYYNPTAEYRMSDLSSSHQDIRSIDIQVYWRNRLDNQLYPVRMLNQSTVSIKCMFRHKRVRGAKGE